MAFLSVPYAILPSNDVDTNVDVDDSVHRSILSLLDKQCHERKNMFERHAGAWCVGSSNGWLILLDTKGIPFLLDLSSVACIHLPPLPHSFMHGGVAYSYYVEYLRKTFVSKAVLMCSSTPSHYMLAIMYGLPSKLAFCNPSTSWVELSDAKSEYCDIVFNNNILYALAEDGSLEGWDFRPQNPIKILYVKPTMDIGEGEEREFSKEKFSAHYYLVISEGEFLLVKRYIGDFVDANGEVVYEGYDDDDGLVCPYRTKHFAVYKLDFMKNKWEKKRSLHDQALFLGANESRSVSAQAFPGCEADSIYFTDDRWEEMCSDYSYGGHDWGVFSLQDKSVKLLAPYNDKMDPPPVWVLPTSNLTT